MNIAIMKTTGQKVHQFSWSDDDLNEQILALEYVIAYLDGRGDAGIVLLPLRIELDVFQGMRDARNGK
jgi:hypothetical protein